MRKILKLIKNTEGQSLVEAALVISFVLVPLILGMVEFGWILNGKITLTSTAREGARVAVVKLTKTEAESAAQIAVNDSVENSSLTNVSATVSDTDFEAGTATVTVTAQIKPIIGLYVDRNGINLKAIAKMKVEER